MRPGDEITKPKQEFFSLFWRPNVRPVFLCSGRRQDKKILKTFKTISFRAKQWLITEIRNANASTLNWSWIWSWLSYRSKLMQLSWESTQEHPFQLKFSMNPSTKRYSKATPAAINRDTWKSPVLPQCCVLLASALQSAGLRRTCNAQNTRGTCWTLSAGRTCGTRAARFIASRIFRSLLIRTCGALDTPQCQSANNASVQFLESMHCARSISSSGRLLGQGHQLSPQSDRVTMIVSAADYAPGVSLFPCQ